MNAATLTECLRRTGTGEDKLRRCYEFMGSTGENADADAQDLVNYLVEIKAPEGTIQKAQAMADGEPFESFIGPPPETGVDASEERLGRVLLRVLHPEKAEAAEKAKLKERQKKLQKRALTKPENWVFTTLDPEKEEQGWKNKVTGHTMDASAPPIDEETGTVDEGRLMAPGSDLAGGPVKGKFLDKVDPEVLHGPSSPAQQTPKAKPSLAQQSADTKEQREALGGGDAAKGAKVKAKARAKPAEGHQPVGGR